MKKLLVLFLVLAMSGNAFAYQRNIGCGLGVMLLGDQDSKVMQLVGTFLNGLITNQNLGITFDIEALKCQPSTGVSSADVFEFVQSNMDSLIRDVAAGNGDSIETLASLMDVQDVTAYGAKLQQNFGLIFPDADVQSAHVADTIFVLSAN